VIVQYQKPVYFGIGFIILGLAGYWA